MTDWLAERRGRVWNPDSTRDTLPPRRAPAATPRPRAPDVTRVARPRSWRALWDALGPSLAALFAPPVVPLQRLFFARRDCDAYRKVLQRRALRRPGASC